MKKCIAVAAGIWAAGFAFAQDEAAREVIVPPTSEWKWLHPSNGEAPAATEPEFNETFMRLKYDDAKWLSGTDSDSEGGGFGYGDPTGVVWDKPANPEHRKTGYLRHKFKTTKPMRNLVLSLQRDDGVIIYLNGKEVARDNVGEGSEAFGLMATAAISGDAEKSPVEIKLGNFMIPPGEHILALSLHNRAGGSSDLRAGGITLKGSPAPAK